MLLNRENGEVNAGMVFVKNSIPGRKFLQDWLSRSAKGRDLVNADNGDLLEVLLKYLNPEAICSSRDRRKGWDVYNTVFVPCFRNAINQSSLLTRNELTYELAVASAPKIKVYNTYRGFMRTMYYYGKSECSPSVNCNLVEGDFVVHGKTLPVFLAPHLVACTTFDQPLQNVSQWLNLTSNPFETTVGL